MFNILVVEDDRQLRRAVCSHLLLNGYGATGCSGAREAYDAMHDQRFDLILSDIMMPDIDGFTFAETVRSLNPDIPILLMTARDDFAAKQRGYQAGIDDFMVKPINLDELLLRIAALLRRARLQSARRITLGDTTLDADERAAYVRGKEIPLTAREFNLLFKLLSSPRRTFTRSQLMDEFWGAETTSNLRSVDVYMAKLREKFSNCKDFEIVTVHSLGYKAVLP